MATCRVCGSGRTDKIAEFIEVPATLKVKRESDLLEIGISHYECLSCNTMFSEVESSEYRWRIQSMHNLELREPVGHISSVASEIVKICGDSLAITACTYKDARLGYALRGDASITPGFVSDLDKDAAILGEEQYGWLMSVIEKLKQAKGRGTSLLLMSKVVEHCFDEEYLEMLLGMDSRPDYIYTEGSDFSISGLSSYSLWNERSMYLDAKSLEILMNRFRYKRIKGSVIENGYYAIWEAVDSRPANQLGKRNERVENLHLQSNEVITRVFNRISGKKTGIFGAGHKGVMISQALSRRGVDCKIFDGAERNVGLLTGGGMVRAAGEILDGGIEALIVAVGANAGKRISDQLKLDGFKHEVII